MIEYVRRSTLDVTNLNTADKRKDRSRLHSKKRTTCSDLMKTGLKDVLLPTLFKVVNNTEQVDEPELACNQV